MNREQQLARILEGWLDGGLDGPEQAELLASLEQDPELRRAFAEQIVMLGAIRAAENPNPRWLALFDLMEKNESVAGKIVDFEQSTMEEIERISDRRWYHRSPALAAAAAVILMLVTGVLLQMWKKPDLVAVVPPPPTPTERPIAMVLECRSDSTGSSPEVGEFLVPGTLVQADGWMSIQTLHGVTITLDAPFRARLVAHDEIRLLQGRARVHVPPGAEGFRLETPSFKILDLGTEFATEVDEDGAGRCRVFEGKADVSLVDSIGVATATRRLLAAESLRIEPSQQTLHTIDENDSDYPKFKLPPRPLLALTAGYPERVLNLEPSCYWRFEELDLAKEIRNEVEKSPGLHPHGSATISEESGGNHAGALVNLKQPGFFSAGEGLHSRLQNDWTVSFFVQFKWLQNFAMISSLKFSPDLGGHPFLLQAYSSFGKSGLNGTGLHAVVRDPPGWIGGVEVFGDTPLRPRYWHHITAVRSGDELILYLDGKPVGIEWIGDAKLDFDYLYVGRLNANLDQQWVGARRLVGHIDELAIFSRALGEDEIHQLAAGKVEAE